MKHIILCMAFIGAAQIHAGDKSPRRGANANAAAASRPSLPGHTSLNASASTAPSSAASDMKNRAAALHQAPAPALDIPYDLQRYVDEAKPEEAIKYLQQNPQYIHAVSKRGTSLLEFVIREISRKRVLGNLTTSPVEYPNYKLLRYILSQHPRLPSKGVKELDTMMLQYTARYIKAEEHPDLLPAMVDVALENNIPESVEDILEPRLKNIETYIGELKRDMQKASSEYTKKTYASILAEQEAQRAMYINALNLLAKRTIAEAEGSLTYRANFPRELRGLTGQYLGRKKEDIPAAAEDEDIQVPGDE